MYFFLIKRYCIIIFKNIHFLSYSIIFLWILFYIRLRYGYNFQYLITLFNVYNNNVINAINVVDPVNPL